jgi:hypothetical protein
MNSQTTFVGRRQRPRPEVITELENINYGILRKHGVVEDRSATNPQLSSLHKSATEGRRDNGTTHNHRQQ